METNDIEKRLEKIDSKLDSINEYILQTALQQKDTATSRIEELENYLSQTDWYAIRFADSGEAIPDEIKEKRASARIEISDLRDSLEE